MLLCAEYIIPVTAEPIEDGAVLVRDGRIADIGGAQHMKKRYPDEEVRDFGRAAIMPGLVNLHNHLEYTVLRGIFPDMPYAEWLSHEHEKADQMSFDDRYDSALLGCLEMISGGVTTVAEFSSTGASCDAIEATGLSAFVYRSVGAVEKREVEPALTKAVADIDAWKENYSGLPVRFGIATKALHACNPVLFREVNKIARDRNLPVAMHLAGSFEEYSYIKDGTMPLSVRGRKNDPDTLSDHPTFLPTGVTPVNYALNWDAFGSGNVLAMHCVHVTDDDIAKLKDYDVAIAVSSRANARLGMGLAPLPKFLNAGIRVGLGTDSPAATDTSDMFVEMRLGMFLRRAVNPKEFIKASTMLELATMGGARALHMEDQIGSIDVGKRANMTVVDFARSALTPLVDPVSAIVVGTSTPNVLFTMIDGKVVYEREKKYYAGVDIKEAFERGNQIRRRLRD